MVKNSKVDDNEINLIELMHTLWEGKWKIAVAVVISFIAVMSYQSIQLPQIKNFTAITEIKPIGNLELSKFTEFNNMIINTGTNKIKTNKIKTNNTNTDRSNSASTMESLNIPGKINKITSTKLLNFYINVLNNKSVFEDAIRKFNLLEASQYNNKKEHSEAITRLASSVKILSPAVSDSEKGNLETSYHTINFIYHDVEKWKSVLTHADEFANKLVKKTLMEEFNNTLKFLKNERKYKLEDISIKINNHLIDYEREISDRVVYLKEQSAIARKLGIAKNTIEVQTFGNQNALLSNVQTDSPFYLRGYEAIDKEIELIELRKNKTAFINGLFELEKKKRAIEQDQTIERLVLAFKSNLLADNNEFSAGSIKAITTKFKYNNNNNNRKMLVMAIVTGLIVGIFYVLISNSFQSLRVSKKN
jgi:LPS O-antigen subunit length determinant protein (WzzB/FepE family)